MDEGKIFGREPAAWIAVIAAVLGTAVTFGIPGLSDVQAAAIVAVLNAAAGVWMAIRTRPVMPAAFTGAVAAGAALLAAYGFEASQEQIGAMNVLVLAALTLLTRQQVSPSQAIAPEVLSTPERARARVQRPGPH